MKTHTPGPWFEATGWVGAGKQPNPRVICRIESYPYFETEANVRLIAAAPELLESLKSAVATFGPWAGMTQGTRKILEDAEAAIAKAEGKVKP